MRDFHRLVQRFLRRYMAPPARITRVEAPPPIKPLPSTHQAAAIAMTDRSTVNSVKYKERCISVSTDGSHEDIVRFGNALVAELQRRGMPFFAHCWARDRDTQNRLFRQGHTKARWPNSPHNRGAAVDIVHYGRYWDLTGKQWAVVGLIGKEVARRLNLKVEWGGDWSFYDPAHWQLAEWKSCDVV